jgi:hypothetical protein
MPMLPRRRSSGWVARGPPAARRRCFRRSAPPVADTLELGSGCTYTLTTVNNSWYGPNGLPPIASDITIEGNGATIIRAFGLKTDQRGCSRPFDFTSIANAGDGSDIGAVELPLSRACTPAGGSPGGTSPLAFGAKTLVALKLAAKRIPAKGPLKVRVANGNGFIVTGRLSGETTKKVSVSRKRRIKLKAKSFSVGAHASKGRQAEAAQGAAEAAQAQEQALPAPDREAEGPRWEHAHGQEDREAEAQTEAALRLRP